MTSEAQLAATADNGGTPPIADGTMQAIVQDGYGSADVFAPCFHRRDLRSPTTRCWYAFARPASISVTGT